jgi:predicted glutamine amidotransferase
MCGIGGFSLSDNSKINPKALANSLLTCLEDRGGMASGFAYQDANQNGVYKDAVTGSQLSLKTMPKTTRNVILHTRLATHGSTKDNRNNHPVISPDKQVALVHNGVIYNHEAVREILKDDIAFDVDTAVIPALIEEDPTLASLINLDGDAAVAWFDARNNGVLNLARLEHSPLVIAQVEDGSLIFASTEDLLWRTLIQLDITPDWMHQATEYTWYQVRKGIISQWEELTRPEKVYKPYDYSYYRHQTSGAKDIRYSEGYDGYGYDDDDLWEMGSEIGYPLADSSLGGSEISEIEDWNESFMIDDPVYFYIKSREKLAQDEDFTWYHDDEYELFKNDIWYIRNTRGEIALKDFGRMKFDTGEMYSYKDDPEQEKRDVEFYGLAV